MGLGEVIERGSLKRAHLSRDLNLKDKELPSKILEEYSQQREQKI